MRKIQSTEKMHFAGRILFSALPREMDWTQETFKREWCSIPLASRRQYLAHEEPNILTSAGRNQLFLYIGSSGGLSIPFCQFFAVGTQGLNLLTPADTSVLGEVFRTPTSGPYVQGNQMDLQFLIGNSQAVGVLTNAGIFGNNASAALGTGTLMTHALISNFNKASGLSYAIDYMINLN